MVWCHREDSGDSSLPGSQWEERHLALEELTAFLTSWKIIVVLLTLFSNKDIDLKWISLLRDFVKDAMGDRRLLPYIHRHAPTPSSVYYDDDLAYWYAKRRRYPDGYYYNPSYHHQRVYPRRYYDDYLTRRSLPPVRHYEDYYVHPRAMSYNHWPETYCSHCRTLPRISSKLVPSMHYDEIRCPHCEAQVRRNEEKIMTYPWTPHDQPDDQTMVLRRVEEETVPHTTVSAPAQLNGNRGRVDAHPIRNTAPPFLFIKGKDKHRLLSEGHRGKYRPSMQVLPEDHISPNDSISNVGIHPFRSRDLDWNRRPRYSAYTDEYFHASPRRVEDSPRPIRDVRPRRHFDGHYVDVRNGKKYKYKVNYVDNGQVDSERRQIRSF